MKTMKMVLMLLLLMSIKVMMRDDEVQISKRSVMILIKSADENAEKKGRNDHG